MENQSSFLLNISIVHRNTQKYFEKELVKYKIGSGQLIMLLLINENEGISMVKLAQEGDFDKGSISKGIAKLEECGYLTISNDENDKRIKRLYTTNKTSSIINELYDLRNGYCDQLLKNINEDNAQEIFKVMQQNSKEFNKVDDLSNIRIAGFQKFTLLDYPGKVACTIFTGGCNLKCPFCHNGELVFLPEKMEFYQPEEILSFLDKRKGILDGVCISGGEPLIQEGLENFLIEIRKTGLSIKLDTNGFYPDKLKSLVEKGLIDYVAMDVKNSKQHYGATVGMNSDLDLSKVEESIKYLLENHVDYEFRTTVVEQFHTQSDFEEIGKWLKGANKYFLQQYKDSENIIQKGLTACNAEQMEEFKKIVQKYVPNVELRGVA